MSILPYFVFLGSLFVFLSLNVIRVRKLTGISLGNGENPLLISAIRTHGNFAEYTPIFLIYLCVMASTNCHYILIHTLAITYCIGRILHIYGLLIAENKQKKIFTFRVIGMVCTFSVILLQSLSLLYIYLIQ